MDWTDDYNAIMSKVLGTPRYPHDCEKCEYKGSTNRFDIYICPSSGDPRHDSLIARYGKEGREYSSFPRFVFAKVVADHVAGDVVDEKGIKVEAMLPHWMLAVLRIAFGGTE